MRPIKKVLQDGRGAVFVPLLFRYSVSISGIPLNEFAKSSGRAVSLYRSFKLLGYDGVVVEVDVSPARVASGELGRREMSIEEICSAEPVNIAIETASRLARMVRDDGDTLCVIHGPRYIAGEASLNVHDIYTCVDNLSLLERLYLDAGCTGVLLMEKNVKEHDLDALEILTRIARLYDVATCLFSASPLEGETAMEAQSRGFDFVGIPRRPESAKVNPCIALELESNTVSQELNAVQRLMEEKPVLLITRSEVVGDVRPQEIQKIANSVKAGRNK
ncbi:MAG: hypothetical protein QW470_03695 [Candidatus Caldarchaeum sp.]